MKDTPIDIMNDLVKDSIETLKELIEENVKPLIKYRADLERKMGNKEISEMYKLEEEV